MDTQPLNNLNICSYNMFGFANGLPFLNFLCQNYDIILLQEHWLTSNELNKLNSIHPNFTSIGVSAMDKKIESGIVAGRPFGGTAFLFKSSLLKHIKFIESDSESGRFVIVRYICLDI